MLWEEILNWKLNFIDKETQICIKFQAKQNHSNWDRKGTLVIFDVFDDPQSKQKKPQTTHFLTFEWNYFFNSILCSLPLCVPLVACLVFFPALCFSVPSLPHKMSMHTNNSFRAFSSEKSVFFQPLHMCLILQEFNNLWSFSEPILLWHCLPCTGEPRTEASAPELRL